MSWILDLLMQESLQSLTQMQSAWLLRIWVEISGSFHPHSSSVRYMCELHSSNFIITLYYFYYSSAIQWLQRALYAICCTKGK